MFLVKKWNEIMGPKDERLEAEENKVYKAVANIFMVGTILTLYYGISLGQVAYVTDHPILTELGDSVVTMQFPLTFTIMIASCVGLFMQTKSGYFSSRKRFAEIDHVPWGFVSLVSVGAGLIVGILTCVMRVLAEIQIVGMGNVMWFGDMAIGIVFFGIAFTICFVLMGYTVHDAIKRRQKLERELED